MGMLFFPSLWRRLRSGDRWPLSNSPSDLNSLSSFASSLLGPGSHGPGKNIPFSSNVLFILKQDSSFGSKVNLFSFFYVVVSRVLVGEDR